MKITERRLRSIIKNVIRESMEDYMSPPPSHRSHDPHNRVLDEVMAGEFGAFCRPGHCEVEYLDGDSGYSITTGYYDSNGTQQVITYKDGDVSINFRDVDLSQ
jgi:hypothetical protein